nr:MAG TPA: Cag pathogenicity island protein [Caudoviricetes sp.]
MINVLFLFKSETIYNLISFLPWSYSLFSIGR